MSEQHHYLKVGYTILECMVPKQIVTILLKYPIKSLSEVKLLQYQVLIDVKVCFSEQQ